MVVHQEFWTVDSLANYLRMHKVTVRRFIREGRFDASLIGTKYLVYNESVVKFIESRNGKRSKAGRPKTVEQGEKIKK